MIDFTAIFANVPSALLNAAIVLAIVVWLAYELTAHQRRRDADHWRAN